MSRTVKGFTVFSFSQVKFLKNITKLLFFFLFNCFLFFLEERSRSSLPATFDLCREALERLHMRSSLRENVMQIVANRNEAEAFLEELAHSIGAKQKHAEDHFVFVAGVDELLGGLVELIGGVHVREGVLLVLKRVN